MEFEKLYTVEDIAEMTGLTSRTIRNYLKDGRLKGKKIGVQWRFTKDNIGELFEDRDFSSSVENAKNQMILDFVDNKEVESLSICSVVDYPCESMNDIEQIYEKVVEVVNIHKETGVVKFSFQFQTEYKKARFIIMGEIECVQKVLDILAQ